MSDELEALQKAFGMFTGLSSYTATPEEMAEIEAEYEAAEAKRKAEFAPKLNKQTNSCDRYCGFCAAEWSQVFVEIYSMATVLCFGCFNSTKCMHPGLHNHKHITQFDYATELLTTIAKLTDDPDVKIRSMALLLGKR